MRNRMKQHLPKLDRRQNFLPQNTNTLPLRLRKCRIWKGVVCKISQSFWSYSPFTLAHAYHFVQERMENAKDRAFQGQFFRRFFPQWLLFFFQYHSVCQRWTFSRRVIISKNQGDLLENTNWSFLVRSLDWKQFFISFFVCRNHFCIICYLLWYAMCYALYIARAQYKRCPVELSVSHSPHGTPA